MEKFDSRLDRGPTTRFARKTVLDQRLGAMLMPVKSSC